MRSIFLLFVAFLVFSTLNCAEIEATTLVIGSRRMPGYVPNPINDLVKQQSANFTHTESFLDSKVVSVDMEPCLLDQPHIQGNWLDKNFPLEKGKNVIRILFEWFPSHYRTDIPPALINTHQFKPLQLPSLYKAYEVLSPGGELIIDHIPYSLRLPSNYNAAIYHLENQRISTKILRKYVCNKITEDKKNEPGIVSKLWQKYDPFSLSTSMRELEDILDFLKKNSRTTLDQQTDLNAVSATIRELAKMTLTRELPTKRKTRKNLMRRKRLAIEKALIKELTEEITGSGLKGSGMIKLFRWVYFMLSRGEGMLSALRKIGFEVDTNEILRTNPNPYTGRRHAWFIEAHKPHLSLG